jgi:hypothetical protein
MAKTFGQYTGGIQAVQGIEQYGAQQAESISKTWGGIANTISSTYKTLNEQEEQTTTKREQAKGTADNLTAIKKLMDANPDTKDSPLSMSINEMILKLGTAGEMNNGQLTGVLKSAEVFTSQLPLTMQLQDKAFLAQTTAGIQKALAAQKGMTVKDKQNMDIPVPSYQNGSPQKYKADLTDFFKQFVKDNPNAQLDVEKSVRDTIQLQLQRFVADPELKKADPTYQQQLIRGFESLGKVDAEIPEARGGWFGGNEEEVAAAMDAVAEADRLANQSPSDIRRAQIAADALDAQRKAGGLPVEGTAPAALTDTAPKPIVTATQKFEAAKTEAQKTVDALRAEEIKWNDKATKFHDTMTGTATESQNKQYGWLTTKSAEARGKREAAQAKLEGLKPESFKDDKDTRTLEQISAEKAVAEATPVLKLKKDLADLSAKFVSTARTDLEKSIRDGSYLNLFGIVTKINNSDLETNPNIKTKRKFGSSAEDPEDYVMENVTNADGTVTTKIKNTTDAGERVYEAAKKLGITDATKGLSAIDKQRLFDALGVTTSQAKVAATAAGKAVADLTPSSIKFEGKPATAEAEKPDIYAMGFDYKMTIPGVFVNERPLTYEEEKDGIRKWFEENHNGVVPSTVDAIYKTIRPEAALIIKTLPTGEKLMHTEKGWQQLTQMATPKALTAEEQSDQSLFNYGAVVGNRRIPTEARPKSGIMVNGFFGGGKKRAEEFAKQLDDTASLIESVPQLLAMFDKYGHSIMPLNQEEAGIADGLMVKIKAAVRPETIGGGPIALPEHAMLEKRVGNPNKFFAWDKNEMAKLRSILDTAKAQTQRISGGVTVTFRPPSIAGKNPVQQNKLDNRINQPQN